MSCIGAGIYGNQNSERAADDVKRAPGRAEQPFAADSDGGGDESWRPWEPSYHWSFGLQFGYIQSQR